MTELISVQHSDVKVDAGRRQLYHGAHAAMALLLKVILHRHHCSVRGAPEASAVLCIRDGTMSVAIGSSHLLRVVSGVAFSGCELEVMRDCINVPCSMQHIPVGLLKHMPPRPMMAAHLMLSSIGTQPVDTSSACLHMSDQQWRMWSDKRWT